MENEIILHTKIDNSGIDKGVSTVNKSLEKFNNTISKTSGEIKNAFDGGNVDKLTVKIQKQSIALEEETNKLQRLSDEYNRIVSGETTPKSLKALEKQLLLLEEQYRKLQGQAGFETTDGMTELDVKLMNVGSAVENLAVKIENIRMNPETSDEAVKLANAINTTTQKAEALKNNLDISMGQETTENIREIKSETSKVGDAVNRFSNRVKRLAVAVLVFNVLRSSLTKLKNYFGGLLMSNDAFVKSLNQIKVGLAVAFQPIYEAILPALNTLMNALAQVVAYFAYFINAMFGKNMEQSKKNAENLNKQAEAISGVGTSAKKAEKQLASFDKVNVLSKETSSGGGGGGTTPFSSTIANTELPELDPNITKTIDKIVIKLKELGQWLWENREAVVKFGLILAGVFVGAKLLAVVKGIGGIGGALLGLLKIVPKLIKALGMGGLAGVLTGLATLWFIDLVVRGLDGVKRALAEVAQTQEIVENIATDALQTMYRQFLQGEMTAEQLEKNINFMKEKRKYIEEELTKQQELYLQKQKEQGVWFEITGEAQMMRDNMQSLKGEYDELGYLLGKMDTTQKEMPANIQEGADKLKNTLNKNLTSALETLGLISKNKYSVNVDANVNNAKTSINKLLSSMSSGINIALKAMGLKPIGIPKLATGAVIPPNKEFMAILGDQKSGTNIETPENLLRKIVKEESGNSSQEAPVVKVFIGDEEIYGRFEVYQENKSFRMNGGR